MSFLWTNRKRLCFHALCPSAFQLQFSLEPDPVAINCTAFNHNGNLLVTGAADGVIRLFGQSLGSILYPRFCFFLRQMSSLFCHVVAFGILNNTNIQLSERFCYLNHQLLFLYVPPTPEPPTITAADMQRLESAMSWRAHDGEVYSVEFSYDENTVLSIGEDGKV